MNPKSGAKSHVKKKLEKIICTTTCRVCTDVAKDHIHYGSVACYACRGFFRRNTLSKDKGVVSKCSYKGQCEIGVISRIRCPPCRYDKCLSRGMNPDFGMTEQDKKEAKAKVRRDSQREIMHR